MGGVRKEFSLPYLVKNGQIPSFFFFPAAGKISSRAKRMKNWERFFWPAGLLLLTFFFLPGTWLPFQNGKWLLVYALAAGCLALLLFQRPVFPEMKRWQVAGLLGLGSLTLLHLFWFRPRGYEFSLLDRLSFFALAVGAWRGFSSGALRWRDFWWPMGAALGLVAIFGLWQITQFGFAADMPYLQVGSFFGHANNAAQFLGLTLLLWWAIPRPQNRWAAATLAAVSAVSLAYLLFSRGRSALIAFALGLLVFGFFQLRARKKITYFFPAAAILLAGGVVFAGILGLQGKGFSLSAGKGPLVHYRADVWAQTLKMVKANPLGVGVDRFAFEFLPFHRQGDTISYTHLAFTPHNEFLRYLAEDGALALLFLAGWMIFLWLWWKSGAVHKQIILPAGMFFLAEMLVQFPWQNPYPFFVGALLAGAMASGIWERRAMAAHLWAKATSAVAVAVFLGLVGQAVISRSLEKTADVFWAKVSCRASPANWNSCLNYARLLLEKGDAAPARREIEALLELEPWNFAAIRHLGVVAARQGDNLEACFLTWKYNDLFGKTDLSENYEKNCPEKWRKYFDRKRPEKYYRR